MGRLAVKILLFLTVIWTAWWYVATSGMQRSLTTWFDDNKAAGWQTPADSMTRSGFPLRIATKVAGITLGDARTHTNIDFPPVTLSTPIYWPGHVTVRLPAEPVTLTTPQGIATLTTDGAEAALRLHPGPSLQLELLRGHADNIQIDLVEGRLASAQSLIISVQQGSTEQTYDIDLVAAEFAPGSLILEAFSLPHAWPAAFQTLIADMTVTFDRPWDRSALENNPPQPRSIKIERAEAIWADLRITVRTDLTVAPDGVLNGTLQVQSENWQRMLDLATASGALSAELRPQVESGIKLLSGLSGGSKTLDLDITIDRGRMRMGFIPLGDAPRFIMR